MAVSPGGDEEMWSEWEHHNYSRLQFYAWSECWQINGSLSKKMDLYLIGLWPETSNIQHFDSSDNRKGNTSI